MRRSDAVDASAWIALAIFWLLLLLHCSCRPVAPAPVAKSVGVATIIAEHCAWCHTGTTPAAGIDLSAPDALTPETWADVAAGVATGAAPLVEILAGPERSLLLSWAASMAGPFTVPAVPSVVKWTSDGSLAGAAPGSVPPHSTGFVLEDGFVDRVAWTVGSRGGSPSIVVYQSYRPGSANPSSYLVFGLPWHDRVGNQSVRFRMRTGRWSGVALRVRSLHPGDRDERVYTRLEIDRDAIAMVSTPTDLETRPPEVVDCCLVGTIYTRTDSTGASLYITKETDLDVAFSVVDMPTGAEYRARVRRVVDGRLLADLGAVSARDRGTRGTWALWKYGIGGPSEWSRIVFVGETGAERRGRGVER